MGLDIPVARQQSLQTAFRTQHNRHGPLCHGSEHVMPQQFQKSGCSWSIRLARHHQPLLRSHFRPCGQLSFACARVTKTNQLFLTGVNRGTNHLFQGSKVHKWPFTFIAISMIVLIATVRMQSLLGPELTVATRAFWHVRGIGGGAAPRDQCVSSVTNRLKGGQPVPRYLYSVGREALLEMESPHYCCHRQKVFRPFPAVIRNQDRSSPQHGQGLLRREF